jgi:hypothetical protein
MNRDYQRLLVRHDFQMVFGPKSLHSWHRLVPPSATLELYERRTCVGGAQWVTSTVPPLHRPQILFDSHSRSDRGDRDLSYLGPKTSRAEHRSLCRRSSLMWTRRIGLLGAKETSRSSTQRAAAKRG